MPPCWSRRVQHCGTAPPTPGELAAYRRHPDTFFGIANQQAKPTDDPLELFDVFYATYRQSSRKKLLELLVPVATSRSARPRRRTSSPPDTARGWYTRRSQTAKGDRRSKPLEAIPENAGRDLARRHCRQRLPGRYTRSWCPPQLRRTGCDEAGHVEDGFDAMGPERGPFACQTTRRRSRRFHLGGGTARHGRA